MVQQLSGKASSALFTQCVATAGAFMVMLQGGILVGWSSPNTARLTSANATIPLTLSQASWVASCLNLGRFASVILVPLLMELAGSKRSIAYSLLPTAVSWALMLMADSAEWLYVARFLGGITFGMAYASFPIFLGEVVASNHRGTFVSVAMGGGPLGSVFGTVGETYLPMRVSSWIYLAICSATLSLFAWLPDSPFHLVKNGRTEEARRALARYHGEGAADEQLREIVNFVEASRERSFADTLRQLASPPIRRALLLVVVLLGFVQLCGLFTILFYMEMILRRARSFLVDPREFVIYANVTSFLATVVAVQIIDRLGRRVLLLVSGVGVSLAMAILGLHFYLIDQLGLEPVQWLPLLSVILFVVAFTVGFMPVPSTVLGEIFPAGVKSAAACVASLTSALCGFASSKSYQPLVEAVGEACVFWIHAGLSALAVPVALFWLPETKGKSFREIQDALLRRRE